MKNGMKNIMKIGLLGTLLALGGGLESKLQAQDKPKTSQGNTAEQRMSNYYGVYPRNTNMAAPIYKEHTALKEYNKVWEQYKNVPKDGDYLLERGKKIDGNWYDIYKNIGPGKNRGKRIRILRSSTCPRTIRWTKVNIDGKEKDSLSLYQISTGWGTHLDLGFVKKGSSYERLIAASTMTTKVEGTQAHGVSQVWTFSKEGNSLKTTDTHYQQF